MTKATTSKASVKADTVAINTPAPTGKVDLTTLNLQVAAGRTGPSASAQAEKIMWEVFQDGYELKAASHRQEVIQRIVDETTATKKYAETLYNTMSRKARNLPVYGTKAYREAQAAQAKAPTSAAE